MTFLSHNYSVSVGHLSHARNTKVIRVFLFHAHKANSPTTCVQNTFFSSVRKTVMNAAYFAVKKHLWIQMHKSAPCR